MKELFKEKAELERDLKTAKGDVKAQKEAELATKNYLISSEIRTWVLRGVALILLVTFLDIPYTTLSESVASPAIWIGVLEALLLTVGIIILLNFLWIRLSLAQRNVIKQNKKSLFEGFRLRILVIIAFYIVLVSLLTWVMFLFRSQEQFFFDLATAMIISWIIMVIIYYIWAIFFYNVNMGWTDEDWESLKKIKEEGGELPDDEPKENPHAKETLGLPPGTVRGTLAVSLLVAGLAMLIASFQLDQTYDSNSLFVDNFEFFKTAFLMMIAFYFGDKSLKAIGERNQGVYRPAGSGGGGTSTAGDSSGGASNGASAPETSVPAAANVTNTVDLTEAKNALKEEESEIQDDGDTSAFNVKGSVG